MMWFLEDGRSIGTPEVSQFVAVRNLQKAANLQHDFRRIAGQLFIGHLADRSSAGEKKINPALENLVPNQPSQIDSSLSVASGAGLGSTGNSIRCRCRISPLNDEARLRK
jgi:hypothetical protein